jgi:hypothetical protein
MAATRNLKTVFLLHQHPHEWNLSLFLSLTFSLPTNLIPDISLLLSSSTLAIKCFCLWQQTKCPPSPSSSSAQQPCSLSPRLAADCLKIVIPYWLPSSFECTIYY